MATEYAVLRSDRDIARDLPLATVAGWRDPRAPRHLELQVIPVEAEVDVDDLRSDPRVAAICPAHIEFSVAQPCRHELPSLIGNLTAIGANDARYTGEGIVAGILDTGIDRKHPAFSDVPISARNFLDEADSSNATDEVGHGTHCAGIICGRSADGEERFGVASRLKQLCVAKVVAANQRCTFEDLQKGIFWIQAECEREPFVAVNMSVTYDSLGEFRRAIHDYGETPAEALIPVRNDDRMIRDWMAILNSWLVSKNMLLIAAAGNESVRPKFRQPADLPASELFSVGAAYAKEAGQWDVALFSNDAPCMVAPGVDILSACPGGGLIPLSGTSMAAPHVVGAATLWAEKLARERALSAERVAAELKRNAKTRLFVRNDGQSIGCGLVQVPIA